MLNVSRSDVVQTPFPHVVKKGILDEAFYRELRKDFRARPISPIKPS